MKIAIDTQTTLGQKSGFGFYNFNTINFLIVRIKISAKPQDKRGEQ